MALALLPASVSKIGSGLVQFSVEGRNEHLVRDFRTERELALDAAGCIAY